MISSTVTDFNSPGHGRGGTIARSLSVLAVCLAAVIAEAAVARASQDPTSSDIRAETVPASGEAESTNAYCPVMPGMLVDPDMYLDYEGKRVYFCCPNCRAAFLREPEKYLDRLPQFGGTEAAQEYGHDQDHNGSAAAGLIRPAAVLTFSLLILTAASGLIRRRKPQMLLRWHKRLGIATVVAATLNLLIILLAY